MTRNQARCIWMRCVHEMHVGIVFVFWMAGLGQGVKGKGGAVFVTLVLAMIVSVS